MHVHLPKHGRRNGAGIGLVGEKGHALLNAERLEDRLRNPEGQTVEWPDQDDAVVALVFGIQAPADCGSDLAEDLRRDVFRALLEHGLKIVGPRDQEPGPRKDLAVVLLALSSRLISPPLLQILLSVGFEDPGACLGQGEASGLQAPVVRRTPHAVVRDIKKEVSQIDGLEDDSTRRIKIADAIHEERAEASEEVTRNNNPRAVHGIPGSRQRGQTVDEHWKSRRELLECSGRGPESLPLLLELIDTAWAAGAAGGAHHAQNMIDFDEDVRQQNCRREVLHQDIGLKSEVVVFFCGTDHEHIGQPMLGDKPLEVAHVGFADAGSAAAQHVEADNLARPAVAMDLDELSDRQGQRKALAAGGGLQTQIELAAIDGNHPAGVQTQPAEGHCGGLRVILGKVE